MKCVGRSFPQGRTVARVGQGALVVVDSLDQPEFWQTAGTQLIVCASSQAPQSLCSKESLDRLWNYRNEGAMLNYLQRWMDQLRWQRLRPFEKLAEMLLNHLEGILNYCRTKVPWEWWRRSTEISNPCYVAAGGIKISTTCCSKPNAWPPPKPNSWS
jgi:hypothetical protein